MARARLATSRPIETNNPDHKGLGGRIESNETLFGVRGDSDGSKGVH
jgi:hypothetical protein